MEDDIANNIEVMIILKGIILSVVLIVIGMSIHNGFIGIFGLIIGSAFSGFSTNNSTKYALIYGVVVGIVSSFLMLNSVFAIFFCMVLGLFGGFIGKVIRVNMEI